MRPSPDAAPSSSPRGEEPGAPASQRDKINQAEGTATWGLPHNHAETHGWARTGTAFVEPVGWGDVPPGHRLELDTCTPGVGVLLPLGQRGGEPGQKIIAVCGDEGHLPRDVVALHVPSCLRKAPGSCSHWHIAAPPPRVGTPGGREQAQGRAMPSEGTCCGLCPAEHPAGEALLDSQVLMQTRRTHVRSGPAVKILTNLTVF